MEKRRRARINQSLNELKQLLLEGNTSKKEVYHYSDYVTAVTISVCYHSWAYLIGGLPRTA
jgi:hypothetical protein